MAQASTIRAGRAFIEISADSTEFQKSLTAIQSQLNAFASNAAKVGLVFSGLGAAILTPLIGATRAFAGMGDTIDKMSARTGQAAEDLSALGFAAERSGASLEQIDIAARGLYQAMERAHRGSRETVEAFRSLGLRAQDLAGLPLPEQMARIADGMTGLATEEQRAAVAMRLFGEAGYRLVPLLKSGRAEIDSLTRRARELGVVMSQEDAAAAAKLTDALTDVQYAFQAVSKNIGSVLAPLATEFATATASAIAFVANLAKTNPVLVEIAAGVGGLVSGLGSLGLAIAGISKVAAGALGGLKSFAGILGMNIAGAGALVVFAKTALAIAALGAAAAGTYVAIQKIYDLLDAPPPMPEEPFNLPKANPANVKKITDDALRQFEEGVDKDVISQKLADQVIEWRAELHLMPTDESLRKAVANAQTAVDAMKNANLEFEAPELLADAKERLRTLTEELNIRQELAQKIADAQSVVLSMSQTANENFFGATKSQIKDLDDIVKKMREIDAEQDRIKRNDALDAMITTSPMAAEPILRQDAEEASEALLRIRTRMAAIEKELTEATRDQADELQREWQLLSGLYPDAVKAADEAAKRWQKSADSVEDYRRKVGAAGKSFEEIRRAPEIRAEEMAFRDMLDSGNWRDANDSVLAEMAALEKEWADNATEIANRLKEAAAGNNQALEGISVLLERQQDLDDRRVTLEGRRRESADAGQMAQDTRLNVLRELDPQRFLREMESIMDGLSRDLADAWQQAMTAERSGSNADPAYAAINDILEKIGGLEQFAMTEKDIAGALSGGTYSGAAAQMMGGDSRQIDIMQKQLTESQKMTRLLEDIKRNSKGGGLGY